MKFCPICEDGILYYEQTVSDIYRCRRCGSTFTEGEYNRAEQKRLDRWFARENARREEREWHREYDDYCRRN